MRNSIKSLLLLAVAAPLAAQGTQQGGASVALAPTPTPSVGAMAPDFTIPWADKKGAKPEQVTLSKLRGKVVVIAFYPADFSRGCTIQMSKYRDDYKKIFGDDVVLLPISRDSITTHTRWADSMAFPFALGTDMGGDVAKSYGSISVRAGNNYFARNVFVIGKDGKVAYSKTPFNPNAQDAYDELALAILQAKK